MFTELKVQSVTAGRQAGRRDEGKASEEESGGNKQRDAVFWASCSFCQLEKFGLSGFLPTASLMNRVPENTPAEG